MEINSTEMTLTLPQEKKGKIMKQCQNLLGKLSASIRKLSQLISRLASTAMAVLPAPSHCRAMQRQQILELQETGLQLKNNFFCGSEDRIGLVGTKSSLSQGKINNFCISSVIIAFDASLKGWGAFCQDHRTAVSWTLLESKCFINVLELKATKFAILTFTRMHASVQSVHL